MEFTRHPCGCMSLLDDEGRVMWVRTLPHRHLTHVSETLSQMELPGFEKVDLTGGCDAETLIKTIEEEEWPPQADLNTFEGGETREGRVLPF